MSILNAERTKATHKLVLQSIWYDGQFRSVFVALPVDQDGKVRRDADVDKRVLDDAGYKSGDRIGVM